MFQICELLLINNSNVYSARIMTLHYIHKTNDDLLLDKIIYINVLSSQFYPE